MRGPGPKPFHLRALEGNPAKRPIPKGILDQAKAIARDPNARTVTAGDAPEWLSDGAKVTWDRIANEKGLAWIESCDRELFATFCETYDRMVRAKEAIDEHGMTYETVNGGVGCRPEVRIANQCATAVRSLASELGLSPTARTRLGVQGGAMPKRASDLPPELSGGSAKSTGA